MKKRIHKAATMDDLLGRTGFNPPVPDDGVWTLDFNHKTGGVPVKVHPNALKRMKRVGYGTCLRRVLG